jgi:hypothetical protein
VIKTSVIDIDRQDIGSAAELKKILRHNSRRTERRKTKWKGTESHGSNEFGIGRDDRIHLSNNHSQWNSLILLHSSQKSETGRKLLNLLAR